MSLVLSLVLAGVTASITFTDPATIVYIYRTEGPVSAARFAVNNFFDKNTDHYTRYTIAFTIWRNRDPGRAVKILNGILAENPSDYTIANCQYLFGLIRMEQYELNEALGHFAKAEAYSQNMPEALERIRIEKSRAFVFLEQYDHAQQILTELQGLSPTNECALLEVRGRVAMETGETKLALEMAKARYEKLIEIGDTAALGYVLHHIGFLEATLGDLQAAMAYTALAQSESLLANDITLNHFILCNWVAINRCTGRDYDKLVSKVTEFAEAQNLPDLRQYLSESLALNCLP